MKAFFFMSISENFQTLHMKYKYETIRINYSIWTGKSSDDYLEIINDRGAQGWRFVCFTPLEARPKGVDGIELVFEKPLD